MANRKTIIHPGKILRKEIEELGYYQYEIAELTGLSFYTIHKFCIGAKSITAKTSVLVGAVLGYAPDYWYKLQQEYDMIMILKNLNIQKKVELVKKATTTFNATRTRHVNKKR